MSNASLQTATSSVFSVAKGYVPSVASNTPALFIFAAAIAFCQTIDDIPPWPHTIHERPQHTIWIEGESFSENTRGAIHPESNAFGGHCWTATANASVRYRFSIVQPGQYLISIAMRGTGAALNTSLDLMPAIPHATHPEYRWTHISIADLSRGVHFLTITTPAESSSNAVDAVVLLREPFAAIPIPPRVRPAAPLGLFTNAPSFLRIGYAPPRPMQYRILDHAAHEIICGGWLGRGPLSIPDVPQGHYTAVIDAGPPAPISIPFARVSGNAHGIAIMTTADDNAHAEQIVDAAIRSGASICISVPPNLSREDHTRVMRPYVRRAPVLLSVPAPAFYLPNGMRDIIAYMHFAQRLTADKNRWMVRCDDIPNRSIRSAAEHAMALGGALSPSAIRTVVIPAHAFTEGFAANDPPEKAARIREFNNRLMTPPPQTPASTGVLLVTISARTMNVPLAEPSEPARTNDTARVPELAAIDITVWNCTNSAQVVTLSNTGNFPIYLSGAMAAMSFTNITVTLPLTALSDLELTTVSGRPPRRR